MDPIVAIAERLLGRADALADELTAAIRRAEPSYDADNLVPADDLQTSVRNNVVYIFTRLAGHTQAPGLAPARATGRRRAEQGAPLPAILHSYRVAGTFLWAALLDAASPADRARGHPAPRGLRGAKGNPSPRGGSIPPRRSASCCCPRAPAPKGCPLPGKSHPGAGWGSATPPGAGPAPPPRCARPASPVRVR